MSAQGDVELACTVSNMCASTGWLVTTIRGRWAYQAWCWGEAEVGFAPNASSAERRAQSARNHLAEKRTKVPSDRGSNV